MGGGGVVRRTATAASHPRVTHGFPFTGVAKNKGKGGRARRRGKKSRHARVRELRKSGFWLRVKSRDAKFGIRDSCVLSAAAPLSLSLSLSLSSFHHRLVPFLPRSALFSRPTIVPPAPLSLASVALAADPSSFASNPSFLLSLSLSRALSVLFPQFFSSRTLCPSFLRAYSSLRALYSMLLLYYSLPPSFTSSAPFSLYFSPRRAPR